eukprot:403346612
MLAPSTQSLSSVMKDKISTSLDIKEGKLLKFGNNRVPQTFPKVKFDINDLEFCELLEQIDYIYKSVHSLNEVFVKYSKASIRLSKFNGVYGPQALKLFSGNENPNKLNAVQINQTHEEADKLYKDFLNNQQQTCLLFKTITTKFEIFHIKLKNRDKALETFKHYHEKMEKLKQDSYVKSKSGDPSVAAKDAEAIARNEKKFDESLKAFNMLNNSCYNDINDFIKNQYKALTPIVIRFSQVAQVFFSKMSNTFQPLTTLVDRNVDNSSHYSQNDQNSNMNRADYQEEYKNEYQDGYGDVAAKDTGRRGRQHSLRKQI